MHLVINIKKALTKSKDFSQQDDEIGNRHGQSGYRDIGKKEIFGGQPLAQSLKNSIHKNMLSKSRPIKDE